MSTRKIERQFLTVSECVTGVSGRAIADCILQLLSNWLLLGSYLVDGPGAMAMKNDCVAAQIHEIFLYTHCTVHALNPYVMKCCSIAEIRNTMDTADYNYHSFSNSPKR